MMMTRDGGDVDESLRVGRSGWGLWGGRGRLVGHTQQMANWRRMLEVKKKGGEGAGGKCYSHIQQRQNMEEHADNKNYF